MQHHEQLLSQVTRHSSSHRPDATLLLFVTFDLLLVPVTQEHGVDVVGKVGCGKENVAVGQPVSEEENRTRERGEERQKDGGQINDRFSLNM